MICQTFANHDDWCENNWRAARRKTGGGKWRFYIWDAEQTLRPGEEKEGIGGNPADPTRYFICSGPAELHYWLQGYTPYRNRFSSRLHLHFDPASGVLGLASNGTDRAVQLFQSAMTKFASVLYSESARWGDMDAARTGDAATGQTIKPGPFTKTEAGYLTAKPYGDWDRNTAYRVNTWLPSRRTYYLQKMASVGLYQ